MIFFTGDAVRATAIGCPVAGVIESFSYDVPALVRGAPGDIAHVRTASGDLIEVSCTNLEPAA
jgi:hypothetical protein